jgi:hypothetical protein
MCVPKNTCRCLHSKFLWLAKYDVDWSRNTCAVVPGRTDSGGYVRASCHSGRTGAGPPQTERPLAARAHARGLGRSRLRVARLLVGACRRVSLLRATRLMAASLARSWLRAGPSSCRRPPPFLNPLLSLNAGIWAGAMAPVVSSGASAFAWGRVVTSMLGRRGICFSDGMLLFTVHISGTFVAAWSDRPAWRTRLDLGNSRSMIPSYLVAQSATAWPECLHRGRQIYDAIGTTWSSPLDPVMVSTLLRAWTRIKS